MKRNDVFPPKYVNVSMLEDMGGSFTGAIDRVAREEIKTQSGDTEKRAVVYLDGLHQGLILNATNWNTLETVTGSDDSDVWGDTTVTLFVDPNVPFGNKMVSGVRIRPPMGDVPQPIGEVADEVLADARAIAVEGDRGY